MTPQDLHQVTRRKLLRDAAITFSGMAILPPFLASCNKILDPVYPWNTKGGSSQLGLTTEELKLAADNIKRLRVWIVDVYVLTLEYDEAVFKALSSTNTTKGWANFIVNVFIDIAAFAASAALVASGNPWAVPAVACMAAFLKDWGFGKDKPGTLAADFAEFQFGHVRMQEAIEQKLSSLVEPNDNYANLRAAWQTDISYNGNTYTIGDLAKSNFPDLGDEYNRLQTGALISFRKSVWNLVIMKSCTFYENFHRSIYLINGQGFKSITDLCRKDFYPKNKGLYVRGRALDVNPGVDRTLEFVYWNLGIGGYPLPDVAANILFKDDTPGNIINRDGLFERAYVFQQFHLTKPDFKGYLELSTDDSVDFQAYKDFNFTGGQFPSLVQK